VRLSYLLACAVAALLTSGCAAHRVAVASSRPPVVIADSVRESLPNDYLRVSFLPAGVEPTTLSRPGALRAFVTATALYVPPLKVEDYPYYSGLANNDNNVLVAMRCQPPHPEKVDAVLATWPNVFLAIQRDVPLDPAACNAHSSDMATQIACYARAFSDPPSTAVPTSLAHTFSYASALYEADNATLAKWLQDNYGIYPAFAGTGYSVKDSYSLSSEPMTSLQILVKSVSSEYILKNVSLADAGCHCISVPPYSGRSGDPLDPDFINKAGGDGACKSVKKLAAISH
jgi:hypothetical protein